MQKTAFNINERQFATTPNPKRDLQDTYISNSMNHIAIPNTWTQKQQVIKTPFTLKHKSTLRDSKYSYFATAINQINCNAVWVILLYPCKFVIDISKLCNKLVPSAASSVIMVKA